MDSYDFCFGDLRGNSLLMGEFVGVVFRRRPLAC